jgi:hypothetical protein
VDGRKRCSNQSCKKQGLERSKARFHAGILSTGIRTWFYVRVDWIVPPLGGETSPLRRLQHVAADRDSPCGLALPSIRARLQFPSFGIHKSNLLEARVIIVYSGVG